MVGPDLTPPPVATWPECRTIRRYRRSGLRRIKVIAIKLSLPQQFLMDSRRGPRLAATIFGVAAARAP
jgi:hypothetical protein